MMKTVVTLLILFTLFPLNTFAQDYTQWGLPDGAKARLGKGSINEIQYSPDGTQLAVAGSIGIWLYDAQTGKELDLLAGHTGWGRSVSFSPDGATIASGSDDGTVLLWELAPSTPDVVAVEPLAKRFTRLGDIKRTALLQNFPNPFNPETWIPYQLAVDSEVRITIYRANGVPVRTLHVGPQLAGTYTGKGRAAYWDGRNANMEPVASGIYFYTLTAGEFTATRKMLIRK